jgi:hypothetical protein
VILPRARLLPALACFVCSSATASAEPAWRDEWPRFRDWEYAATGVLLTGSVAARLLLPPPPPVWSGGILFDDSVAALFAVRHEPTRSAIAISSHVAAFLPVAYRAFDSTLVPGEVRDDWDLAQQMILIDLETYAVIAAVVWGSQIYLGRDRPIMQRCNEPEVRDNERVCKPGDRQAWRSFISGHVAVGVAAAGLTCLHHANLPLYGSPWDGVACGTTIGFAVANSAGRLASWNHWPTDVALGALLGLGAGWLMPAALHYGFDGRGSRLDAGGAALSRRSALVLPLAAGSF